MKQLTRSRASTGAMLALALICSAAACGPKTRTVPGEVPAAKAPEARPAVERAVPLLRWIPADAELVVVAQSLEQLEKLGAVIAPVTDLMGLPQSELFGSAWLRGGIDQQAPVAVFTQGLSITVLATMSEAAAADPAVLDAAWKPLRQGPGAVVATHWSPEPEPAPSAWFEAVQAASEGASYSGLTQAPWAFARDGAAAVRGYLPVKALLAAAVGGEQYLSCLPLLTSIGGARLEARLQPGGAALGQLQFDLLPASADALAQLLGPGPSPGMLSLRESEAVHASVAVELPAVARALHEQNCPELAQYFEQAAQNLRWSPAPRALHAAGTRLDTSNLSGSVALHVDQRDKRFVAKQLDIVPGRSFFESTLTVEGQKVKRLSVPTMSAVYYQLTQTRLLFATKKDMMARLLGAGPPELDGDREVAAAGIWPARLPQLRRLLSEVAPSSDLANLWSDLLMRFEFAGISVRLSDHDLTLEISVRPAK